MFGPKKDFDYWVKKFYEGSLLFPGWNKVSDDLLGNIKNEKKEFFKQKLSDLGRKISQEWAKDNKTTKISSSKLQNWGDRLKKARKKEAGTIEAIIFEIEQEVDNILST